MVWLLHIPVGMKFFIGNFILFSLVFTQSIFAGAAKIQCKTLFSAAMKKEQLKKDKELPDRFEAQRDWGTKFLSDKDPTWRDPIFIARIKEFAVPNITNYGGKANVLVNEYQQYMNNFFKGEVKNFTSNGTDANNMLFLYAGAHLAKKLEKEPTQIKFISFADIYGGSYGPILNLKNARNEHIEGPFIKSHEKMNSEKLADLERKEKEALKKIEIQIRDLNNQVGAIFIEPIPAAHGVKVFRAEFLNELRELADKYDTPIFADEILTGGGRTGKFWAFQHYEGFVPDLVSFGKGLAMSGIFAPNRGKKTREYSLGYAPPVTTMVSPLALVQALQVLKTIWHRRLDLNAAEAGEYLLRKTFAALTVYKNKKGYSSSEIEGKIYVEERLSGVGLLITGFPSYILNQNSALKTENKFNSGYNQRILPILTTTKDDIDWVIDHHLGW